VKDRLLPLRAPAVRSVQASDEHGATVRIQISLRNDQDCEASRLTCRLIQSARERAVSRDTRNE
jgi:hypothetical protein